MTCSISGGFPPANLSLDCPGLTNYSQGQNSSYSWVTASGTATRALNGKICNCTAEHYAWIPLGSNLRITEAPGFNVYCEFLFILTALVEGLRGQFKMKMWFCLYFSFSMTFLVLMIIPSY